MYDRKTWVVLALCGGLLAVNFYFKPTPPAEPPAVIQTTDKPTDTSHADLTVEPPPPPTEEQTVKLESSEVIFTLTNMGGGIKYADLKNQFKVGSNTDHVQINQRGSGPIGALAGAGENLENIAYAYKPDESVAGKKAVYIAKLPSGLIAKKTFALVESDKPGSPYLLDFDLKLENASTNAVNLNQWSLFLGEASPLYQAEVGQQTGFFWRENGGMNFKDGSAFKGGMLGGSPKLVLKSESTKPVEFAGVTNQFFATVIRPKEASVTEVWAKKTDVNLTPEAKPVTSVRAGIQLPTATLAPSELKTISYNIFVGPKHNPLLRKMEDNWGDGWGDVMQYGWFSIVSRTLNYILNSYHSLLDKVAVNWSWGLAVIFLTITVRLCIWPLHAKSTHTMKKMSKLQPKMAEIKEKYADDPNKINTETMGLYKKYGINPLGGCLPMFIQIPVFFGFYRMLQYAVELRGHSFLWIHDLSQPDTLTHLAFLNNLPLNILPIIMAITSFLQMRMTPKTGDATQQKIMMFMPFMFFFFCYNFASALALYWTTQNIFSIGQTWLMNKIPEPELKARTTGEKQSWAQRMVARQAEMERVRKQGGTNGMRDATPDKKKPRPPRTGG